MAAERPSQLFVENRYLLLFWPMSADRPITYCTHAVTVVGACDDYIYYLDPNDASHPIEPRKVYALAYSDFCSNVVTTYGVFDSSGEAEEKYGWQKETEELGR